jgi:trimethylamine-N-oxide reductase (cytochrome c)
LGIPCVFVSPDVNTGTGLWADKFIPVYPNADPALMAAIAYIWITEDTYNKDYVATHVHGFDKWQAYVLGDEDGIPKTPAWASEICGTPEWTIKALARFWGKRPKASFAQTHGGGVCRGNYSTEGMRMEFYLMGMQGWGGPGIHQIKNPLSQPPHAARPSNSKVSPEAKEGVMSGRFPTKMKDEGLSIPPIDPVQERPLLHSPDLYRSMMWKEGDPKVTWYGGGTRGPRTRQFTLYEYPWQDKSIVRMMWYDCADIVSSNADGNKRFLAHQVPTLEFVLTQSPWMEDSCFYSDIVLPVSTNFELYDLQATREDYTTWCLQKPSIEPVGESMSDYVIVSEIARKLDFYDEMTSGKTVEEWVREAYDTSGTTDLVSWEELDEKGYFVIGLHPDAAKRKPRFEKFYDTRSPIHWQHLPVYWSLNLPAS